MSKLMQFCCLALLLCYPLALLGAPPDAGKHKPPRATLNENDTPLDRVFEKAKKDIADKVAAQKEEEKKLGKTDCADADALPENDNDKPGKKAKACKVMQFKGDKVKDPVVELNDVHSNKVGKKVKTRMKLVFDGPQQRGKNSWDDLNELKYTGRPNLQFAGAAPGRQASDMRIRTIKLPGSEGI